MSKYSRTRKAICRISFLTYWPITRSMFKRNPSHTWKDSWRRQRVETLKMCGTRKYFTNLRYADLRKQHINVWNYIHY